ncbi:uncharacterized protein FTOL_11170 [Fusarium torulosum]|uniref:Uncharacterized protein n=1 Tax=Fusarium torulosum TaxID=33205 RepID=A0AAE8MJL7_9HYPO|nr:uncharacterized protein FTOL_11170 [Fusarium torulosum]
MPPFRISPAPFNTAVHFKDVTSFRLLYRVLQEAYGSMHFTLGFKDGHYVIGTFTSHGPTVEEVLSRKGVTRRPPSVLGAVSHVQFLDQEDSVSQPEVIDLTGED